MKIKGDELKAWADEAWPGENWFWDHELFDDAPLPDVEYDTDDIGNIEWQGPEGQDPTEGDGYNLDTMIKKWRKARTHDIVTLHVPKDKSTEFKALAKQMGCTVAKE